MLSDSLSFQGDPCFGLSMSMWVGELVSFRCCKIEHLLVIIGCGVFLVAVEWAGGGDPCLIDTVVHDASGDGPADNEGCHVFFYVMKCDCGSVS